MASIETPNPELRQAIAAVIDERTRPTKEDFQMIRQGLSRDEIHVLLGHHRRARPGDRLLEDRFIEVAR